MSAWWEKRWRKKEDDRVRTHRPGQLENVFLGVLLQESDEFIRVERFVDELRAVTREKKKKTKIEGG